MPLTVSTNKRLLVVSHPCIVDVNQAVYRELIARGWDIQIVVPSAWQHEFATSPVRPDPLAGLEDVLLPTRVVLSGRPQRHFYLSRPGRTIRAFLPHMMFLEQEPFSASALQWGLAARRAGIPFGVQLAENLDRHLPLPVRQTCRWVLRRAAFVAARSPTAAGLARRWGAQGSVGVAAHAVPAWSAPSPTIDPVSRSFTIGYAGRLVPEKGICDLLKAARELPPPLRLLIVGDGPLKQQLSKANGSGLNVEIVSGVSHSEMGEAFNQMDVLVLPSRSTPKWVEQFGRVLVEAMSQSVPVVGSRSGEIPWVIETTGGGLMFAEGDVAELTRILARLRDDPGLRGRLGSQGAAAVENLFSVPAAATALEELIRRSSDDVS